MTAYSPMSPAERAAMDAVVAAEKERHTRAFCAALDVSRWAKAHPGVLPDYLAADLAELDRLGQAYDDAVAAYRAARDAAALDVGGEGE